MRYRVRMALIVVATFTAKPGLADRILDSFREISPLVHQEKGCELYAAHRERDGDAVVIVERWASAEDLEVHSTAPAVARLHELNTGLLARPIEVWHLDEVPLGEPVKGRIPD
jgi:quinol monooxygenase YgiN